MKKGLFFLAVFAVQYVLSVTPSDPEVVRLKDVTSSFGTDKRTFNDPDLPDELTFHINRGPSVLTLNLKRNHGIDPNADVYFVRKLKDGRSLLEKTVNLEKEYVAYYQDRDNGAFMTVRSIKSLKGQWDRVIYGNVRIRNRNCDLRPAETDVTSRYLLDVPDLHGTRYILRDQASIQRNTGIEKDAAQLNEINLRQELKDLLQRFRHGQHNRNNFQPTNSALSPRNGSSFQNRDKKNNLKETYWIEVAVLIDSGIWDFYTLLTPGEDKRKKVIKVKARIREAYSHIINGVNLRYNDIEDPGIDISVTLRAFYIFETMSELTPVYTKVKTVNGVDSIEAFKYLNNVIKWDKIMDKKPGTDYDHAMLFTRYDLYIGSPLNNSISGLALPGGVCDVGKRLSLLEAKDYFLTVNTAAHELGHNLGAVHDGEGDAIDCPADDLFIMTLHEPSFDLAKPNSSNPWYFSNCSVKAFKETLRNKTCVSNEGVIYDEKTWTKYMKFLPGQVYNTNEQCEVINGPGSKLCMPVSADICRFMKCTNPKTGLCMQRYFSAARGTTCGKKMVFPCETFLKVEGEMVRGNNANYDANAAVCQLVDNGIRAFYGAQYLIDVVH